MEKQIVVNPSWEEIGISNDFLFGKIMQQPDLCKELLHRILPDLEIDHIEYPEAQKGIRPDVDAVKTIAFYWEMARQKFS